MTAQIKIETRSAAPIETREDDPVAAATAAVEQLRTAAEEHRAALDTRVTSEVRGVTDRIAALETRLNRPGSPQDEQRNEPAPEVRAFGVYLRRGAAALNPDEQRALPSPMMPPLATWPLRPMAMKSSRLWWNTARSALTPRWSRSRGQKYATPSA